MIRIVLSMVVFGLLTQAATAESVSVAVTINAVKAEAKEMTVTYKTKLEEKSITLDVSRKAEITLNGEESDLASLGAGLKATVEYNKELEIVIKIVATGKAVAFPERVDVTELERPFAPCLSEDGMTIYYEKRRGDEEPIIYTAHRRDVDSFFEKEKMLFEGQQPIVTNDGLEIIFCAKEAFSGKYYFYSATRDSIEQSFRRPKLIRELRDPPGAASWSRNARLSSDGLTLFFTRYPEKNKNELVTTSRANRNSPWSEPKLLKLPGSNLFPNLLFPFVTEDGLTMLCIFEGKNDRMLERGNLIRFTRTSTDETFGNPEFVELEGIPKFVGRWPQHIPATKEFFFLQSDDGNLARYRLIVIKNFPLRTELP